MTTDDGEEDWEYKRLLLDSVLNEQVYIKYVGHVEYSAIDDMSVIERKKVYAIIKSIQEEERKIMESNRTSRT